MRTPALALIAALLALSAAPAGAESWHARDRHADVRSYEIDLAQTPHGCDQVVVGDLVRGDRLRDITSLHVDHGTDTLVATVQLADVRRVDRETSYELAIRTPHRTYLASVFRGRRGKAAVELEAVRPSRDPDAQACGPVLEVVDDAGCPGLVGDLDPRADTVTVTVPRTCLGAPDWVKVGAASGWIDARVFDPRKPILVVSDTWGAGDVLTHLLPALSPKVHAG